jgi:hypothetical protein
VVGALAPMEIPDPTRQTVEAHLHYAADNQHEDGDVLVDATHWHAWAVEWLPDKIITYVDGVPWWSTTDGTHIPTRSMHLCMQLDDVGGDVSQGGQQVVDWVRQYAA